MQMRDETQPAGAVVRSAQLVMYLRQPAGLADLRHRLADHRLGLQDVVAIALDQPAILVQAAVVLAACDEDVHSRGQAGQVVEVVPV